MYQIPILSTREVDIYSLGGIDRIPDRKSLFVLGGRAPSANWLKDLAQRNEPEVWAVDSGAAVCRAAGLSPKELIGDRDSAEPADWEWAISAGASERRYPKDKDRTDFQLALSIFREKVKDDRKNRVLLVSACFGGAFDHLISTFDTLASSEGDFFRCMADGLEGAFFLASGQSAALEFNRAPASLSLLAVTDICRGVTISGVKWPLDQVTLERKYPWAVSNETINDATGICPVTVSCAEGSLAVYWISSEPKRA